ncbi:hypothetical protein IOD13_14020 [Brevibacterium casei]|nr:hypothetical protein [Brevibacterium casei]
MDERGGAHHRSGIRTHPSDLGEVLGGTEPAEWDRQGRTPIHRPLEVDEPGPPIDAGGPPVAGEPAGDVDGSAHRPDEGEADDGEDVDRAEHRVDEREDEDERDRRIADERRRASKKRYARVRSPVGSSMSAEAEVRVRGSGRERREDWA